MLLPFPCLPAEHGACAQPLLARGRAAVVFVNRWEQLLLLWGFGLLGL